MDMELVDGYDTLPPLAQEKVKRALEEKHVDDKDWNGVCPWSLCRLRTLTNSRISSAIGSIPRTRWPECL